MGTWGRPPRLVHKSDHSRTRVQTMAASSDFDAHCAWLDGLRRQYNERVNACVAPVWPTGCVEEEEAPHCFGLSSEQEAVSDLSAALDRELDFTDFEEPVYRGLAIPSLAAVLDGEFYEELAQWRGLGDIGDHDGHGKRKWRWGGSW